MTIFEFADRVRVYLETPHPALVQLAETGREARDTRPSWMPKELPEEPPTRVQ